VHGSLKWVKPIEEEQMKINKAMKRTCAAIALLLAGCANPGVVHVSENAYVLSREDHAGIFGSASKLKAGVVSDANAFAAGQGKVKSRARSAIQD
jgi:hypothetical protein